MNPFHTEHLVTRLTLRDRFRLLFHGWIHYRADLRTYAGGRRAVCVRSAYYVHNVFAKDKLNPPPGFLTKTLTSVSELKP